MSRPGPPLIDTHAHMQDSRFDGDRDATLERAWRAGLRAIVCVGWDLESSRQAVELAGGSDAVYAAVGIHPNYAGQASASDWDELCRLARRPGVVGIGETGLDTFRGYTRLDEQELWFRRHLDLAAELDLPVIVHNRQADEPVRRLLRDWTGQPGGLPRRGLMHCFSADRATLDDCLDLGLTISIAGPVTFKNAGALREVARAVPDERLVVETDCPYLTPHPHRGERNEPAYVAETARHLADLRGQDLAELAVQTTRNAADLFRIRVSLEQGAEPL